METEGTPGARVIVGLGNPGSGYADTRHNLGQRVVDRLAARLGARFQLRGPAHVAEVTWGGQPLYLAKPLSFMNVTGGPVARLLRLLASAPPALVVVHDDLDLPFGTVRIRHKGRHGGHRGMLSVLQVLGTDEVRRVKIGVGRPDTKAEVVDWVLTAFSPEEREALDGILERAADAALALVAESR